MALSLRETWEQFRAAHARRAPGEWVETRPEDHPVLDHAIRALEAYFRTGQVPAGVPLTFSGSPFQVKVWKALRRIPEGSTASYGEIAEKIGHPGAARAVGGACGANPLPIFVPCHRVLASGGKLGGFGGGLDMKDALLKLEKAR